MANICDMRLYIAANTDEDAKALFLKMAETFKKATDVDALVGISPDAGWRVVGDAIESAADGCNRLCLLTEEPDTAAEGGWMWHGSSYGKLDKPCVKIELQLKWSPSYDVAAFCNALDHQKYGCAVINGGEYMCAMGEEYAYVQWGDSLGGPSSGGMDCDEFKAWRKEIKAREPESLCDVALRMLVEDVDLEDFFWESFEGDEDEIWDEFESASPGLLDEIAKALGGYEDGEELREEVCCPDELYGYLEDIEDDDQREDLEQRLDAAMESI